LSGDIDGDGTLTNNAYHVLYLDGVTDPNITTATVIDGFTVTGGNADHHSISALYQGGGLYCDGSSSGNECSPTIANVTFSGNWALYGGAMYNNGYSFGTSSPSLSNVTFTGNQVHINGGAMYNNGDRGVSSPNLVNVTFSGNSAASSGGAMYNYGRDGYISSPSLVNVTFSGNSAAGSGGAMYNYGFRDGVSYPNLVNVILWGNNAPSGKQIYDFGTGGASISYSLVPTGTNDVFYGIGDTTYWGAGNITAADADPRFVAPIAASSAPTTTGDYRLQAGSPAIDAGNNLSVTVATDLDGNPRIANGVVDMGAYEKQPGPALGLAKQVAPATNVAYQGVVTYTLVLSNSGGAADGAVILTDTLPAEATFAHWIEQNGATIDAGRLAWSDAVDAGAAITVSFAVTNTAGGGATITNTAWFSGSQQAGSAAAAFATATTLAPSGSGNWSEVFPPCSGVCKYTIPAGVAITLTTDI
ncbi:MAG TPA: hypothetical protein DCL15_21080, partial [Chloroflexi bacterium]|nr:hypothetical protein [Chloroflexota bacterium]